VKALVKVDAGSSLSLKDIDEPEVGLEEVKVEVKAAGICGTDLHILRNEYKHAVPVVLGHEYSGLVAAVGRKVKTCAAGDRVVSLTAAVTCGHCEHCLSGIPMLCAERKSIGSGVNGAFTKYIIVHERLIKKIPESVSLDAAALTEPLACVVHGVMEMAQICAGDVVLISGPGVIGLLSLQVARAAGARVVVCGTAGDRGRLEIARSMGAGEVVDLSVGDVSECVRGLTGGRGADAAIECAGVEKSAAQCLQLLRKRGRYIQMGLFGKPITADFDLMTYKEIRYSCSFASTHSSFSTALRLMDCGLVDPLPLISARLPLDSWKEGFRIMESKEGLKVLFYPD
jgi:L-iditol 2-dehydrogenase